jgi:hypothetical protein
MMTKVYGKNTVIYIDNSSWHDVLTSWDLYHFSSGQAHGPSWSDIVGKPTSTHTATGNTPDPEVEKTGYIYPPDEEHQITFNFDLVDEDELGDFFSVGDVEENTSTGHKCTCDWDTILQKGCQCGGK